MRIAIIGLGLMGGSLALALRRSGWASRIIGVSRKTATLDAARVAGAIDDGGTDLVLAGMDEADVIVLATPVRTLLRQLPEVGRLARPGTVILDLGSTKAAVCAAMGCLPEGLQPLGGHPMCGREIGGFDAADASLYQGTTFVLCPLPRTSDAAVATARSLAEAVGSRVRILHPAEHDRAVAAISHLPYLAASALVSATTSGDDDALAFSLAASGFRDTTRVAASDVDMMLDILLTNRGAVLECLALFGDQLNALEAMLQSGDESGLRNRLMQTQQARRAMRF